MTFCHECTNFASAIGGPYLGDHYLHKASIKALQESSRECELCSLMLDQFDEKDQTRWILEALEEGYPTATSFVGIDKNGPWKYYQIEKDVWTGLLGLQVNCGNPERNDDWSCGLGVFTDHDDPAALSGDIAGRRVESHSGSDASIKLIQNWVTECLENHSACLPSSSLECDANDALRKEWPTKLPTRVIDVGCADGTQTPYLYITDNDTVGNYIALSHCWGKAKLFTTTKVTLNDRKAGFTLSDLSRTFRDAVTITRKLNIRYLWIDSLCIIQDSPKDWQKESAAMATIYTNAFLTIAATASPDSKTGCLFQRPHKKTATTTYTPPSLADKQKVGKISFQASQLYLHDPLKRSPLNTRAWTVQERILSRRIIHFASTQLFYDCRHSFLSENGTYKTLHLNIDATNNPLQQSFLQLGFHAPDVPQWHQAFQWQTSILGRWMELVSEYTRRELSFASDMLPALGGIVERVAARMGDEFLAGLWRENLHIELLWMARDSPHSPAKGVGYRAPSWSWANLVGENVYFNYRDGWRKMRSELEIVEVDVRWEGEVCTSKLLGARLRVRGWLEAAMYVDTPSDYVLSEVVSYPLVPAPMGTNDGIEGKRYAYQWAVFDREPPDVSKVLWCLCVCQRAEGEYWHLILDKVEDMVDTYRRIGLARIDLKTGAFGDGNKVDVILI